PRRTPPGIAAPRPGGAARGRRGCRGRTCRSCCGRSCRFPADETVHVTCIIPAATGRGEGPARHGQGANCEAVPTGGKFANPGRIAPEPLLRPDTQISKIRKQGHLLRGREGEGSPVSQTPFREQPFIDSLV